LHYSQLAFSIICHFSLFITANTGELVQCRLNLQIWSHLSIGSCPEDLLLPRQSKIRLSLESCQLRLSETAAACTECECCGCVAGKRFAVDKLSVRQSDSFLSH